jgi:hypothetical protein
MIYSLNTLSLSLLWCFPIPHYSFLTTTYEGVVTTAGNNFLHPSGVSISRDGLFALVADQNQIIFQLQISTSSSTIFAGNIGSPDHTDGIGTNARFNAPVAVSISPDGLFALVVDSSNFLIRMIILSTISVNTLAGRLLTGGASNGIGSNAYFSAPTDVTISPNGLFALVGDRGNHLIRQINISTKSVTTLAGASYGFSNGVGTVALFADPSGICYSSDSLYALVADTSNQLIRRIEISTKIVTTLAGGGGSGDFADGVGTNALFSSPFGVRISTDNMFALVTDDSFNLVRLIEIATVNVTTLAGAIDGTAGSRDGIGTNSQVNAPLGVSISSDGLFAFIADRYNNVVRRIDINRQEHLTPSVPVTGAPSVFPSQTPTVRPSARPSPGRYSFGVLFGDHNILSPGNALFVNYFVSSAPGPVNSSLT